MKKSTFTTGATTLTSSGPRTGTADGSAGSTTLTTTYVDSGSSLTSTSSVSTSSAATSSTGLITTTGVTVTLDESGGLQNSATANALGRPVEDGNDNDTGLTLPTAFSGRLTALGAGSAVGAALSGYDGSNTGADAFTLNPTPGAKITDVRTVLLTGPCTGDPYILGARRLRSAALIEIQTDSQHVGIGETYAGYFCPELVPVAVEYFKPILVGADLLETGIHTLRQRMAFCERTRVDELTGFRPESSTPRRR